MRVRPAIVGVALLGVVVTASDAAAFTCPPPMSLLQDVLSAAGVFEATVAARHTLEPARRAGSRTGPPPPPIIGADKFELSLQDVVVMRGMSATTVHTPNDNFQPGRRYVFFAHRRGDGGLGVGSCSRFMSVARAGGLRAWIASLAEPADGGRIYGSILVRPWGRADIADWPSVEGARITARGPIVAEATTSVTGEYALSGLPDGKYALSVALPAGGMKLERYVPTEALLIGDHAAVVADFYAYVTGTIAGRVVDQHGASVAKQTLYLYGAATPPSFDEGSFGLLNTDADGYFLGDGVAPGRYLVTIQDPFEPAYAPAPTGGTEVVMGWGERVDLPTFVVRRGQPIDVQVFTVDANGQPVDDEVQFQLLGPQGRLLRSGHYVETSRSGHFPQKLMRGVRYRFTGITADGAVVTVDRVIDGSPIRIVLPR
jgi:hypothetical protein